MSLISLNLVQVSQPIQRLCHVQTQNLSIFFPVCISIAWCPSDDHVETRHAQCEVNKHNYSLIHLRPKYDMSAHWPRPQSFNINYPEWETCIHENINCCRNNGNGHTHTYKQVHSSWWCLTVSDQPWTFYTNAFFYLHSTNKWPWNDSFQETHFPFQ